MPSTPTALCCWLRGDEKGDLLLQARAIEKALAPALHFHRAVDAFRYKLGASGHGRDLTGYEDGTENPDGDEAVEAALVQGQGAGLDAPALWPCSSGCTTWTPSRPPPAPSATTS